eukprot:gene4204-4509_t
MPTKPAALITQACKAVLEAKHCEAYCAHRERGMALASGLGPYERAKGRKAILLCDARVAALTNRVPPPGNALQDAGFDDADIEFDYTADLDDDFSAMDEVPPAASGAEQEGPAKALPGDDPGATADGQPEQPPPATAPPGGTGALSFENLLSQFQHLNTQYSHQSEGGEDAWTDES